MSQERLNGLAMLSIENEFAKSLDYASLIDTFASKNVRRVIFKWYLLCLANEINIFSVKEPRISNG